MNPRRLAALSLVLLATSVVGCASSADDEDEGSSEGNLTASGSTSLPHTPIYAPSRTQSPITRTVARRLATLPTGGSQRSSFAKIGDSQTVNAGFMHCFAHDTKVELADHRDLEPARQTFLGSFDRESLSARVGAAASFALGGPLDAEVRATSPRYAVVMYGSNDIQNAPTGGISTYARNMMRITDALLQHNVIPILTSPPPRPLRQEDVAAFGAGGADVWVPRYTSVVRGIAQARQVPFVDLERELRKIPKFGIGSDNLHLIAAPAGACHLDGASLGRFGVNVRNLVTLEALARASAAAEDGAAPDADAPELEGSGSGDEPFVVPELPFSDFRAASESTAQGQACGARALFTYRVNVTTPSKIHVGLFAANAQAFVVRDGTCTAVKKGSAVVDFARGQSEIVVTSTAAAPSGDHLLTITPDGLATHVEP